MFNILCSGQTSLVLISPALILSDTSGQDACTTKVEVYRDQQSMMMNISLIVEWYLMLKTLSPPCSTLPSHFSALILLSSAPPSSSVRPQRMIQSASASTQISVDKKALFHLKPKFLEVVRSLPSVDPTQSVFSYEEVIPVRDRRTENNVGVAGHTSPLNIHPLS